MSGQIQFGLGGEPLYEIVCDECDVVFNPGDDSFYSWRILCTTAEAEGWDVQSDQGGTHRCPDCLDGAHVQAESPERVDLPEQVEYPQRVRYPEQADSTERTLAAARVA
jgi:hypothetical protein